MTITGTVRGITQSDEDPSPRDIYTTACNDPECSCRQAYDYPDNLPCPMEAKKRGRLGKHTNSQTIAHS